MDSDLGEITAQGTGKVEYAPIQKRKAKEVPVEERASGGKEVGERAEGESQQDSQDLSE